MRKRELERRLKLAMAAVQKKISANARQGFYAAGLSSEGYAGGFKQALSDVLQLLYDVEPNDDRHYWHLQDGSDT